MRGDILVIDDEKDVYEDVREGLPAHNVHHARTLGEVSHQFAQKEIDLAIVDLNLKVEGKDCFSGLEYIKTIRQRYPFVTIAVHSGYRDIDRVTLATKNGADRFWYKGWLNTKSDEFKEEVRQLVNAKKALDEEWRLKMSAARGFTSLPADVDAQLQALDLIRTKRSFILWGERGLGMENFGLEILRRKRGRPKYAFSVDLSRFSTEDLLRFTEKQNLPGNFIKKAQTGILYLKNLEMTEIGVQEAFFQLISQRQYLQTKNTPLKTQLIFALHDSPDLLLQSGRLLPTLCNFLPKVWVKPLRLRKDELPHLLQEWLKRNEYEGYTFSPIVQKRLRTYSYPGNLSELDMWMTQILAAHHAAFSNPVLARKTPIGLNNLPPQIQEARPDLPNLTLLVAELELGWIETALENFMGKAGYKAKVAAALGIGSVDNLKKTYIDKYWGKYPDLVRKHKRICKAYKLK